METRDLLVVEDDDWPNLNSLKALTSRLTAGVTAGNSFASFTFSRAEDLAGVRRGVCSLVLADPLLEAGLVTSFSGVFLVERFILGSVGNVVFLKSLSESFQLTETADWFKLQYERIREEELRELGFDFDLTLTFDVSVIGVDSTFSSLKPETVDVVTEVVISTFNFSAFTFCFLLLFEDGFSLLTSLGLSMDGSFFTDFKAFMAELGRLEFILTF